MLGSPGLADHRDERWFIPDVPRADGDAFAHVDIADNLKTMIVENTCLATKETAAPRLMIGLTGRFGVGKSTVVEILRDMFATDPDHRVLRVSAERHTVDDLPRALIYAFAEKVSETYPGREDDVTGVLKRLEYEQSREVTDLLLIPLVMQRQEITAAVWNALGTGWKNLRKTVYVMVALLTVFSIVYASFFDDSVWTLPTLVGWIAGMFLLSVGVPFVLYAWGKLGGPDAAKRAFDPGKRGWSRPRAETADELEHAFADLVALADHRLVIAVDDVDRLDKDTVLGALNSIRSFQMTACGTAKKRRSPVFIVSVDEDVVSVALERKLPSAGSDTSAKAFLGRLFTQRQPMPPHQPTDLVTYARTLLDAEPHAGARILGDRLDRALGVLIHDDVRDPRHVITLLNAFFGAFRTARRREDDASSPRAIRRGEVTESPRTLARIVVLRTDHPSFYEALLDDDELLDLVAANVIEGPIDGADHARVASALGFSVEEFHDAERERTKLELFVSGTQGKTEEVESLQPFLRLGQDPVDRTLGSLEARRIRDLLVSQQAPELHRLLEGYQGDARKLATAGDQVVHLVSSLSGLRGENAVTTASRVAALLDDDHRARLAVAVGEALSRSQFTLRVQDAISLAEAAPDPTVSKRLAEHTLDGGADQSPARRVTRVGHVLESRNKITTLLSESPVADHLSAAVREVPDAAGLTPWLLALVADPTPVVLLDLVASRIVPLSLAARDGGGDIETEWGELAVEILETSHESTPVLQLVTAGLDGLTGLLAARAALADGVTADNVQQVTAAVNAGFFDEDGETRSAVEPDAVKVLAELFTRISAVLPSCDDTVIAAASPVLVSVTAAVLDGDVDDSDSAFESTVVPALLDAVPTRVDDLVRGIVERWQTAGRVSPFEGLLGHIDNLTEDSATAVKTAVTDAISGTVDDVIRVTPLLGVAVRSQPGRNAMTSAITPLLTRLNGPGEDAERAAISVVDLSKRILFPTARYEKIVTAATTWAQWAPAPAANLLASVVYRVEAFPDALVQIVPRLNEASDEARDRLAGNLAFRRPTSLPPSVHAPLAELLATQVDGRDDGWVVPLLDIEPLAGLLVRRPDLVPALSVRLAPGDDGQPDPDESAEVHALVAAVISAVADGRMDPAEGRAFTTGLAAVSSDTSTAVTQTIAEVAGGSRLLKVDALGAALAGVSSCDAVAVVERIAALVGGSEKETRLGIDLLAALATLGESGPVQDSLDASELAASLSRWVFELTDPTVADDLAMAFKPFRQVADAARAGLGNEPAKRHDSHKSWIAAVAALH